MIINDSVLYPQVVFEMRVRPSAAGNDPVHIPETVH